MKRGALQVDQLVRPVPGGIGTFVSALLASLAELGADESLSLLHSKPAGERPFPGWRGGRHELPVGQPWAQLLWDAGVPARTDGLAFYHSFSFGGPNLPKGIATAVTIHDLLFQSEPEAFTGHGRRWHERKLVARRNADLVVADSPEVAAEIEAAGVDRSRIRVIVPGADHLPPADREGTASLLAKLGVEGMYLLSVGTKEPRKNLGRVFSAYRSYRARAFDPLPLVVAGPAGWGGQLPLPAGAVATGFVPAGVLAGLLVGSAALVYAPLREGFGLPAVEALRAAVPLVVARTVPAARYGGLAVEPTDEEEIAEAMLRVGEDERLRSELVTHGLLAVGELTWAATAKGYLELWQELAG